MMTLVRVESFWLDPGNLGVLDLAGLVRAFWLEGKALLADADDESPGLSVIGESDSNALADAVRCHFCFHGGSIDRLACGKDGAVAQQGKDEHHCGVAYDAGKCHVRRPPNGKIVR